MSKPDHERRTFHEVWIEPWFRMASFVSGFWVAHAMWTVVLLLAIAATEYHKTHFHQEMSCKTEDDVTFCVPKGVSP